MKVLVTSKSFGRSDPSAVSYLTERGIQVLWSDVSSPIAADIARQIPGCDGLIVGNDPVDRSVIEAADRLKVIHMHGTGLDSIDMAAATERGILVANAPGANRNAVAELTIAFMLTLGRRLVTHVALLQEGRWERTAGNEISGSIVGIIGLGNIGRRVVELLSGFDVSVVAYDPAADAAWAAGRSVRLSPDADEVFRVADWLILTAPLTPATDRMVNRRTLSLMKRTAYLVNTARGGLVDEDALCDALRSKRIAGAALDAFAEEPLPADSPLRKLELLMTPHIAATTIETSANVSRIVARNVAAVLLDGATDVAVNAGLIPRPTEASTQ